MHADSRVVLYPMKAENRRLERLENIYSILSDFGFDVQSTVDYSDAELENIYLEGTALSSLITTTKPLTWHVAKELMNSYSIKYVRI